MPVHQRASSAEAGDLVSWVAGIEATGEHLIWPPILWGETWIAYTTPRRIPETRPQQQRERR